jgi:hypothetical protein
VLTLYEVLIQKKGGKFTRDTDLLSAKYTFKIIHTQAEIERKCKNIDKLDIIFCDMDIKCYSYEVIQS